MKKIIFGILCFFGIICPASAHTLVSEDLPYYVKIKKSGVEEKVINVKKIYDQDTKRVVFNVDFTKYNTINNFTIYDNYTSSIWLYNKYYLIPFDTIVYYGYNLNPTDLNYFITQVYLWEKVFNCKVTITDNLGNPLNDYQEVYNALNQKVNFHVLVSGFVNKTYEVELWDTLNFKYGEDEIILDNPEVDGLIFKNDGLNLTVTATKVGKYNLNLFKNYEQDNHCYSDGTNVYWQNNGGPSDLSYSLNINVLGINLKVEEELESVNDKYGDAKINHAYELYLDDELKYNLTKEEEYIKKNATYLLKDTSSLNGFKRVDDLSFSVKDQDYIVNIKRSIIKKNFISKITTSNKYFVYLKSTSELYAEIDSNTVKFTLPYGIYYITDNKGYYQEIKVLDELDEEIEIKNKYNGENNSENFSSNIPKEDEKITVLEKEDFPKEDINPLPDNNEIIVNPLTNDNIKNYILIVVIESILTIFILHNYCKNKIKN